MDYYDDFRSYAPRSGYNDLSGDQFSSQRELTSIKKLDWQRNVYDSINISAFKISGQNRANFIRET